MTRVLLIGAVLATLFWVYSVVDCAILPPRRHRGVSKGLWMLIVIVLPVVGGVLWFTVGRVRASSPSVIAPDDDPAFLNTIGNPTAQDERIRRLEEELARLDDEDPDDKPADGEGAAESAEEPSPEPAPRTPPDDSDDEPQDSRG